VRLLLPEHDTGENSIGGECLTCDKLENADMDSIQACYHSVLENRYVANEESTLTAVTKLDLLLQCMKTKLWRESRTAKLWIQYMHHMETLRMFIRAERSGDWNLHLVSVTRMLNIFAATAHNQCARCARMYLPMMLDLPDSHPWLYEQFL